MFFLIMVHWLYFLKCMAQRLVRLLSIWFYLFFCFHGKRLLWCKFFQTLPVCQPIFLFANRWGNSESSRCWRDSNTYQEEIRRKWRDLKSWGHHALWYLLSRKLWRSVSKLLETPVVFNLYIKPSCRILSKAFDISKMLESVSKRWKVIKRFSL